MHALLAAHRSRVPRRRRVARVVFALVVLAAVGEGAWLAAPRLKAAYTARKVARSLEQTRAFLAQNDLPQASLALKVALESGRQQVDVWRAAAEFAERTRSSEALHLRREILAAAPDSLADRLALAQTALSFRDYRTANEALAGATREQKTTPRYKQVVVAFALATNQPALADALLSDLATADADASVRLLHATVLLRHPQPEKAAAARVTLAALAQDPAFRLPALRVLVEDAFARRDFTASARLARELATSPGATLADQLAELNSRLFAGGEIDPAQLAAVQARAAASPADTIAFVQWMLAQKRAEAARDWLDTLPAAQRSAPEFAYAKAEIAVALGEWNRLGEHLRTGAWGPLPPESISLALSAHTLHSTTPGAPADALWEKAVVAGGTNLSSQRALLRLAGLWRWDHASRSVLFAIVRAHAQEIWAYEALVNGLQAARDTRALRDALVLWRNAEPNSTRLQHDCALLTLLLQPSTIANPATDALRRLHESEPGNPVFATGHAFALWRLGRGAEAAALIDRLARTERDYPPRAPYVAAIYASAGRATETRAALSRVVPAGLLPEEAALVVQASGTVF